MPDQTSKPQRFSRSDKIAVSAVAISVLGSIIASSVAFGSGTAQVQNNKEGIAEIRAWKTNAEFALARVGDTNPMAMAVDLRRAAADLEQLRVRVDSIETRTAASTAEVRALAEQIGELQARAGTLDGKLEHVARQATANSEALRVVDGPIGAVVAWPSNEPIPHEWHPCDGAELRITGESDPLWQALKITYGKSDRLNYVVLPDFRGMFLRGVGGASEGIGESQAFATGMPQQPFVTESAGDHNHRTTSHYPTSQGSGDGGAVGINGHYQGDGDKRFVKNAGDHSHKITGGDTETRPVNYAVQWIIKTGPRPIADASYDRGK